MLARLRLPIMLRFVLKISKAKRIARRKTIKGTKEISTKRKERSSLLKKKRRALAAKWRTLKRH